MEIAIAVVRITLSVILGALAYKGVETLKRKKR